MKLYLMATDSANNVMGKTITPGVELDINLKRDVDIVSPQLILSTVVGVDLLTYNYASIPALGRFYFIDGIESVNGSMWKLNLTCDVIETYKGAILNCPARIKRNLKTGDYHTTSLDMADVKTISKHSSGVTLTDEYTNILTVVEGGEVI